MSVLLRLCSGCLAATMYVPSCLTSDAEVVFYTHGGYAFSTAEQTTIETIAQAAARDAKRLLPALPPHLVIRINPGRNVVDEIGVGVSPVAPNVVYWMVDPDHPAGVIGAANTHLRATLFHAFHRLARLSHFTPATLMDHVVDSGMAMAFERDFGRRQYPWHEYPADVHLWVTELRAQPRSSPPGDWMTGSRSERPWLGIRAGTYIADRAMRASGKSSADLVSVRSEEILRLAGFH